MRKRAAPWQRAVGAGGSRTARVAIASRQYAERAGAHLAGTGGAASDRAGRIGRGRPTMGERANPWQCAAIAVAGAARLRDDPLVAAHRDTAVAACCAVGEGGAGAMGKIAPCCVASGDGAGPAYIGGRTGRGVFAGAGNGLKRAVIAPDRGCSGVFGHSVGQVLRFAMEHVDERCAAMSIHRSGPCEGRRGARRIAGGIDALCLRIGFFHGYLVVEMAASFLRYEKTVGEDAVIIAVFAVVACAARAWGAYHSGLERIGAFAVGPVRDDGECAVGDAGAALTVKMHRAGDIGELERIGEALIDRIGEAVGPFIGIIGVG